MTMEEIIRGESKNLEFKAERPKDSSKYMKTVVAFANGKGGSLVFGVEDGSRKVTGIPKLLAEMRECNLAEPEFIDMEIGFRVNLYRRQEKPENLQNISETSTNVRVDVGDVGDNVGDDSEKPGESSGISSEKFGDTHTITGTEKDAETDTNTKTDTNTNTNTKTDTNTKTYLDINREDEILNLLQNNPDFTLDELVESTGLSKSGVRYIMRKLRDKGLVDREGTRKNGRWIVR